MKNLLFALVFGLFGLQMVGAQTISVEQTGDEWVITSTVENADGSKNTTISAAISSEKAKETLLNMAFQRSEEIAAAEAQIRFMERQKARLDELILEVTGQTFEAKASELYADRFIGSWSDGERVLVIEAKNEGERAAAFFEKDPDRRGAVKIDGTSVAVIFDLFESQKGEALDLKFSLFENVLVAEIDGKTIKFKREK